MPETQLKNIADKAGVSLDTAEKAWDRAKEIAREQKDEDDPQFWGLVVHITKNKLGLKEMSIEDKIDEYLNESLLGGSDKKSDKNKYKDLPLDKSSMIGMKGTMAVASGVLTPSAVKKFFTNKSFKSGNDYVVDYDTYLKISAFVKAELKKWHKDQDLPYYGK